MSYIYASVEERDALLSIIKYSLRWFRTFKKFVTRWLHKLLIVSFKDGIYRKLFWKVTTARQMQSACRPVITMSIMFEGILIHSQDRVTILS